MNSSVRQSMRFLQKKSLVVPIHQKSSLVLSTLKKPADHPLHVSTSVENLKFKCEASAMSTVMKKKNITSAYLATRWAVPNALALTPYPTFPIMTLNLSPGKAGYSSWSSIKDFVSSLWEAEVINESDRDIAFFIEQPGIERHCWLELKAGQKHGLDNGKFKKLANSYLDTTAIIRVGSKNQGRIDPGNFAEYKKLSFYIDGNGKLAGRKMLGKDMWADLVIH